MNMRPSILFLATSAVVSISSAQGLNRYSEQYEDPTPALGWNILTDNFDIPEIAHRMRTGFVVVTTLTLDSTGQIIELTIDKPIPLIKASALERIQGFHSHLDSAIIARIQNRMKSIQWNPARFNGQTVEITFTVPFVFEILGPDTSPVLRITYQRQFIRRNH